MIAGPVNIPGQGVKHYGDTALVGAHEARDSTHWEPVDARALKAALRACDQAEKAAQDAPTEDASASEPVPAETTTTSEGGA